MNNHGACSIYQRVLIITNIEAFSLYTFYPLSTVNIVAVIVVVVVDTTVGNENVAYVLGFEVVVRVGARFICLREEDERYSKLRG